jgi:hypothetical protein
MVYHAGNKIHPEGTKNETWENMNSRWVVKYSITRLLSDSSDYDDETTSILAVERLKIYVHPMWRSNSAITIYMYTINKSFCAILVRKRNYFKENFESEYSESTYETVKYITTSTIFECTISSMLRTSDKVLNIFDRCVL